MRLTDSAKRSLKWSSDRTHSCFQGRYIKEWAENSMMHVLVRDVEAWWQHISSLDLANRFGVSAPEPPRIESWGLTVIYVFDPAGVLWHFAESTKKDEQC